MNGITNTCDTNLNNNFLSHMYTLPRSFRFFFFLRGIFIMFFYPNSASQIYRPIPDLWLRHTHTLPLSFRVFFFLRGIVIIIFVPTPLVKYTVPVQSVGCARQCFFPFESVTIDNATITPRMKNNRPECEGGFGNWNAMAAAGAEHVCVVPCCKQ